MGFQKPSKIQERALPLLLQNPSVQLSFSAVGAPSSSYFAQSTEYDRPVAVGNRKDSSFRPHHALACRYGSQAASGAPHVLISEALANRALLLQAVCIAPSRELALQIISVVQRMGEYTPVECFHAGRDSVKRGMPKLHQQIVIGTPGTIIDVSRKLQNDSEVQS